MIEKITLDISQRQLQETHNQIYENGSFEKRFGKTTYWCFVLKGYLEILENSKILVFVEKQNDIRMFLQRFDDLFGEDFKILYKKLNRELSVKNNSNKAVFMTRSELLKDSCRGMNKFIIPIFDFENMNGSFFKDVSENFEEVIYHLVNMDYFTNSYNKRLETPNSSPHLKRYDPNLLKHL